MTSLLSLLATAGQTVIALTEGETAAVVVSVLCFVLMLAIAGGMLLVLRNVSRDAKGGLALAQSVEKRTTALEAKAKTD